MAFSHKYYCNNCGFQVVKKNMDPALKSATCPQCHETQDFDSLKRVAEGDKTALILRPPEKSRIDSYRYSDSVLEISMPRKGLAPGAGFVIGFAVIWLSFLVVWTSLAMQASIFFALFSLPFWAVGFGMLYGVTKNVFEEQKLELDGNKLIITKTRLLNSKIEELQLMDIDNINLDSLPKSKFISSMTTKKVPTIKSGKNKETFLEYATTEEKEWAVKALQEYMVNVKGKKV